MNPRLQRLRAEVASDLEAFFEQLGQLEKAPLLDDRADMSSFALVAVSLHHAYGAIESALSRLVRTLDGSLPEGADWHQALLESSVLEIPDVRPALISRQTLEPLRHLLGFRHFFRHAYAVRWDFSRLEQLRNEAARVSPLVRRDFEAIDALLEQLAREGE